MPGKPSESRSRSTGGVITPRSSAMSGSSPSSARARRTARAPARAASARAARRARARDRPVGDEAAEVVDPRQVEELERARKRSTHQR
jgi:hypothetical protein